MTASTRHIRERNVKLQKMCKKRGGGKLTVLLASAAVFASCGVFAASPLVAATPVIRTETVTFSQTPARLVTIGYTLEAADERLPADQALLKVGVYADDGASGIGAIEWYRLVNDSPQMELKLLDGEKVRAGGLDGLDLLVMPGGDSKLQFTSLGPEGIDRMKAFVAAGGGYIGTCGGCYLMLDRTGGSHKRAHMIPWDKSGSEHSLLFPTFRLNEKGAAMLGLKAGTFTMRYHGGPFLYPCTNAIAEAHVESWGTFESEACMTGRVDPRKRMYGATAIIGGTYGKGRVLGIAGHPEYFDSTLSLVKGAFRYVTGRDVTFPARLHTPRAISVGFLAKGISGVATAETALAIAGEKDFDLVPIDTDGIFQRRLDGIDVLVVTSDSAKKDKTLAAAIKEFAARGGKVVGFGSGCAVLPESGIKCKPRMDTVLSIKRLFN